MFSYLLGHSPRYFQENFAGKLGQKVKQAGQAAIGILDIVCFDVVRDRDHRGGRGDADGVQAPLLRRDAAGLDGALSQRSSSRWPGAACVLSKAFSDEVRPRPGG